MASEPETKKVTVIKGAEVGTQENLNPPQQIIINAATFNETNAVGQFALLGSENKPSVVARHAIEGARARGEDTVAVKASDVFTSDASGAQVTFATEFANRLRDGARYFLGDAITPDLYLEMRKVFTERFKHQGENEIYWSLDTLKNKLTSTIKEIEDAIERDKERLPNDSKKSEKLKQLENEKATKIAKAKEDYEAMSALATKLLAHIENHLSEKYKHLNEPIKSATIAEEMGNYKQMPLQLFISQNVCSSEPTMSLTDSNYKFNSNPQPFALLSASAIDFQDMNKNVRNYIFGTQSAPNSEEVQKQRLKFVLKGMIESELELARIQGVEIISGMPRGLASFLQSLQTLSPQGWQDTPQSSLVKDMYWQAFAEVVSQEKYNNMEIYINPLRDFNRSQEALKNNHTGAQVVLHDRDVKSVALDLVAREASKPLEQRKKIGLQNASDSKGLISLLMKGMHYATQIPDWRPGNPKYGQEEALISQLTTTDAMEPTRANIVTSRSLASTCSRDMTDAMNKDLINNFNKLQTEQEKLEYIKNHPSVLSIKSVQNYLFNNVEAFKKLIEQADKDVLEKIADYQLLASDQLKRPDQSDLIMLARRVATKSDAQSAAVTSTAQSASPITVSDSAIPPDRSSGNVASDASVMSSSPWTRTIPTGFKMIEELKTLMTLTSPVLEEGIEAFCEKYKNEIERYRNSKATPDGYVAHQFLSANNITEDNFITPFMRGYERVIQRNQAQQAAPPTPEALSARAPDLSRMEEEAMGVIDDRQSGLSEVTSSAGGSSKDSIADLDKALRDVEINPEQASTEYLARPASEEEQALSRLEEEMRIETEAKARASAASVDQSSAGGSSKDSIADLDEALRDVGIDPEQASTDFRARPAPEQELALARLQEEMRVNAEAKVRASAASVDQLLLDLQGNDAIKQEAAFNALRNRLQVKINDSSELKKITAGLAYACADVESAKKQLETVEDELLTAISEVGNVIDIQNFELQIILNHFKAFKLDHYNERELQEAIDKFMPVVASEIIEMRATMPDRDDNSAALDLFKDYLKLRKFSDQDLREAGIDPQEFQAYFLNRYEGYLRNDLPLAEPRPEGRERRGLEGLSTASPPRVEAVNVDIPEPLDEPLPDVRGGLDGEGVNPYAPPSEVPTTQKMADKIAQHFMSVGVSGVKASAAIIGTNSFELEFDDTNQSEYVYNYLLSLNVGLQLVYKGMPDNLISISMKGIDQDKALRIISRTQTPSVSYEQWQHDKTQFAKDPSALNQLVLDYNNCGDNLIKKGKVKDAISKLCEDRVIKDAILAGGADKSPKEAAALYLERRGVTNPGFIAMFASAYENKMRADSELTRSRVKIEESEVRQEASPLAGKTVALLDVDHTLMFDDTLNEALLEALKSQGIKDVYLFTDMTLRKTDIEDRVELVKKLEARGFVVHGVVSSADYAWHLDEDELNRFYKEFFSSREVNLTTDAGIAAAKALVEKYPTIKAFLEGNKTGQVVPGAAFDTASQGDFRQELFDKSNACKALIDLQSLYGTGYPHPKGVLFEQFLAHAPRDVSGYVFVDDNEKCLAAVPQANQRAGENGVKLVAVNAVTKAENGGLVPRTKDEYKHDIKKGLGKESGMQEFKDLLKSFKNYLSEAVTKALATTNKEQVQKEAHDATATTSVPMRDNASPEFLSTTKQQVDSYAVDALKSVIEKMDAMNPEQRANYVENLLSKKTMAMIRPGVYYREAFCQHPEKLKELLAFGKDNMPFSEAVERSRIFESSHWKYSTPELKAEVEAFHQENKTTSHVSGLK